MLTATYTLVALSVEQANVRLSLLSFQKYVQSTLVRQQRLTLSQLEYACETLERLYQACHWRKIELYLIPALQNATEQANQLLDELSRLNQAALSVIRRLQATLDTASEQSERQVTDICESIETFCTVLLERLEKEEKELFSIARAAIGGEAWFDIANKFLAHDAQVVEARRVPASAEKDRKALSQAREVRASLRDEDEIVVPVPKLRYHRRIRSAHRAAADPV
jgi:hemerythrin-like domain-containing protein